MASAFFAIFEDFESEMDAIRAFTGAAGDARARPAKVRVASANAATLLLAATFEEFVRESARAFAKQVVAGCSKIDDLPPRLVSTAWQRTMQGLARMQVQTGDDTVLREDPFLEAPGRFEGIFAFCRGDLSQDIYHSLIHNENNMRPQELNGLFRISGLKNVCGLACSQPEVLTFFGTTESGKANALFVERLEDFFERRNQVAHSLNLMRSSSLDQISADADLLQTFGKGLCSTLEHNAPATRRTPRRKSIFEPLRSLRRLFHWPRAED